MFCLNGPPLRDVAGEAGGNGGGNGGGRIVLMAICWDMRSGCQRDKQGLQSYACLAWHGITWLKRRCLRQDSRDFWTITDWPTTDFCRLAQQEDELVVLTQQKSAILTSSGAILSLDMRNLSALPSMNGSLRLWHLIWLSHNRSRESESDRPIMNDRSNNGAGKYV